MKRQNIKTTLFLTSLKTLKDFPTSALRIYLIITNGIPQAFSIKNDTKRCVDYLIKAISFAQSNNRDDLNWHFHGSKLTLKTHNWLWVAYYYEHELFDKTNALLFYDKNIEATKDYYGEKSTIYYNELIYSS